jgi:hypothetical protein
MKGLILYAGFVIAWTVASVLIASYIERVTSPQIGTIVLLAMFFSGLVVSWIATPRNRSRALQTRSVMAPPRGRCVGNNRHAQEQRTIFLREAARGFNLA